MAPSKRFWCCIIVCTVLHLALVECKKIDDFKSIIHKRCKRDISLEQGRKFVDFTASVVLGGISLALSISNPLFMIVSVFVVGTLVDLVWPKPDLYQPIKANVIADIRNEMNQEAVAKMKMKLKHYVIQIRSVFSVLRVPGYKVQQWTRNVLQNGLSFQKQASLLQEYKSLVSHKHWDYFKTKIISLASDVGNDGDHFHIQNDPTSSLAYYKHFVTLQIGLWVVELMLCAGDDADIHLRKELQNKIKITVKNHYKYVMWAIHKSATIIESNHGRRWIYKEVVDSWYKEFPLEKWKELAGYSGQSRFIRSSDRVSFKFIGFSYKLHNDPALSSWMSCYGSGSECAIRNCPGIDNPFDAGEQYKYNYKCRGEVFWIYDDIYNYIKACDKVAIYYSSWGNRHYWLSLDWYASWTGRYKFFNTRTCPGTSFMSKPFNGRCSNEIFTIEVEGKACGELVEDRDVIALKGRLNNYVASSRQHKVIPGWMKWWRIFKHDSFLKSVDNNLMK